MSKKSMFAAGHRRGDYQRGVQCRRAGDRCPPDASHAFREGYRAESRRHMGRFHTVPARLPWETPTLRRVTPRGEN